MDSDKTQLAAGAAVPGADVGFWRWHSPPAKKLTRPEIDRYLAAITVTDWTGCRASESPGHPAVTGREMAFRP